MHDAIKAAVHEFGGEDVAIQPLERFEFYDASRECFAQQFAKGRVEAINRHHAFVHATAGDAFAVVQCVGERRPYGNVLLQKGVVGPDGKDLLP